MGAPASPAPIAVRPHFYVGAALLVVAAPLALLASFGVRPLPADVALVAYLGGLTLFAQGVAFWYLPSFAKRAVVLDGMASYSGPLLLPAAVVGAALGQPSIRDTMVFLGLGLFAVVGSASVLVGPRWRSGVPFWRVDGPFQAGDLLAALTLGLALLGFAGAGAVALAAPAALILAWPAALALFALGALAHLVPRARARALVAPVYLAGLLAAVLGALLAMGPRLGLPPGAWLRVPYALCGGFVVAALAIAPPGRGKPRGPRLREAGPLGAAALLAAVVAVGALAGWPVLLLSRGLVAFGAILLAVGLAVAAVALLTMPVLFNQKPRRPLVLAAAALGALAAVALAARLFAPVPAWAASGLSTAALLVWLAGLEPLRIPRRECPPEESEPS